MFFGGGGVVESGERKDAGEEREIGICQVEARRKTPAWDEEQGCLAADRETSVLGDKDRGALSV